MRTQLTFFLVLCSLFASAQNNIKKTAGVNYTEGPPTYLPNEERGSEIAIDTVSGNLWQWHRTPGPTALGSWIKIGQGIDVTVGGVPPAYAPFRNQSWFAINGSNELYHYSGTGTVWNLVSGGGGGGGTWGSITGTLSDQTDLQSALNAKLSSEVDGDITNELQTITNASTDTTHTATLSNSGGSLKLKEGANITLTTTGTGLDGVVTIAASGGGGGSVLANQGLTTRGDTVQLGIPLNTAADASSMGVLGGTQFQAGRQLVWSYDSLTFEVDYGIPVYKGAMTFGSKNNLWQVSAAYDGAALESIHQAGLLDVANRGVSLIANPGGIDFGAADSDETQLNNFSVKPGSTSFQCSDLKGAAGAVQLTAFQSSATSMDFTVRRSSSYNYTRQRFDSTLVDKRYTYGTDISSTFTKNSLVSKFYVDNRVPGLAYKATATLDFPSTAAGAVSDLTITVTNAALSDVVTLGVPNGAMTATATYMAWVSGTNTVKVRFSPKATEDPASGTFKVIVHKQ